MGWFADRIGMKAVSAHRKQNKAEALRLYREAFAKGTENPAVLKSYASLAMREGLYEESLQTLKRLDSLPGLSESDRNEAYADYAIILWKTGHLDHALEVLGKRLEKGKNGLLYSVLGYLLIEKGDKEEALRLNREALDYDAEDPIFLDNMGQTLYRLLDDEKEAEIWFRRALEQKPNAIDTNYFLARIEGAKGEKESAIKRLDLAAEGNFSPLNYATPERIAELRSELQPMVST